MTQFKYPHTAEIKSILKDKAYLVERDGLNYLIPKWQQFADIYADKEDVIYEWLNDLDARRIIDEILTALSEKERAQIEEDLRPIDNKVIENTFEINECVWGEEVEVDNNYNRKHNWYYYRMNQKVFDSELGRFTKR
jgi:hypothetical protein